MWRSAWAAGRFFWIGTGRALTGRLHVAFAADDRESVDAFYRAALAAGGADNGPPGLRPHYHANYYGAFVPVPRTRSSHDIAASTVANFGFKSGTRIIDLLVSL
jgi:hypothetical protein